MNRDVAQLLLQVDASVALAQRNLNQLASEVDGNASRMDASLGRVDKAFSRVGTSAQSAAQVFLEGDRAAKQLIASVDPLFAAQMRYDQELEKAQSLQRQGMLTAQQFAKVQMGLKAQLDDQIALYGGLTRGVGNARLAQMEMMHVVRGSVDQFAAGASISQIFAMHISMVAQAASMGAQGTGKFAAFLQGPYFIAVAAGVAILTKLITAHHEAATTVDSLVEKMRKQADEARMEQQAHEVWAKSIDGVREAQEKLRKELEQSLKVEAADQLHAVDQSKKNIESYKGQIPGKAAEIGRLTRERGKVAATLQNPDLDPSAAAAAQARLTEIDARVKMLRKDISTLKASIADAERSLVAQQIKVGEAEGKAVADLSAAASRWGDLYTAALRTIEEHNPKLAQASATLNRGFETLRKAMGSAAGEGLSSEFAKARTQARDLGNALRDGKLGPKEYATEMLKVAAALNAAVKAAQDAKKHVGTGEFGKQIGFDDAAAIARRAGLTVTSAQRSTARQAELYNDPAVNRPGNPVARPGSSAHEGVNGKWALDIAFAPGLTADKLRKVYGDQGVTLSALFKEKGHFHIEGSRSQAAAGERSAEVAANRQIRDDGAYARESDQLDAEILAAKRQLAGDFHEQASLAREEIDAQKDKQLAAIDTTEQLKQIDHTQAELLRGKIEELAAEKKKLVAIHEQIQRLDEEDKDRAQQSQILARNLEFLDSIARTASQHRKLQLEILDIVYQEKLAHLETLKLEAEKNGNLREANRIQAQINNLPTEKAQDQQHVERGTQGPWQSYIDSLPHTADDINQGMQAIEVQGLNGAIDALSRFTDGWDAMRQAALSAIKDVLAQMIRLQLMKLAFSLFGGTSGAAPGLGASIFPVVGGVDPLAPLPGLAGGGWREIEGVGGVDQNILSLNGKGLARVSRGESLAVIPKPFRPSIPRAANNNGEGGGVVIHSHFHNHVRMSDGEARRTARQHASVLRDQLTPAIR